MGGLAAGLQPPLEHAAPAGHDGLGVSRAGSPGSSTQRARAASPQRRTAACESGAAHLLVRHPDEQQVRRRRRRRGGEQVERADEGGEPALHVDGAGGHEPVAFDRGGSAAGSTVSRWPIRRRCPREVSGPRAQEHRQRRAVHLRRGLVPDLGRRGRARPGPPAEPLRHPAEPRGITARRGDGGQLAQEVEGVVEDRFGEVVGRKVPWWIGYRRLDPHPLPDPAVVFSSASSCRRSALPLVPARAITPPNGRHRAELRGSRRPAQGPSGRASSRRQRHRRQRRRSFSSPTGCSSSSRKRARRARRPRP